MNGRGRDGRVVAEADGPRMRAGRRAAGFVAAGRSRPAQLSADLAGKAVHGLTGG
ncbi:hypothetical protein ACFO1B_25000 [Dactylosporangium siamense]|uniref:Uncharacterized protein n=1 Tax=Dactylosporangium siamense TaxID=685454 RepID=A0A919UEA2_9ACTN|nr:hypothetical protein [Dactylosporangium siamense]GIG47443.1 hypothetical protein Dsi01nite_054840 [Dactylosporangium siamense]